MKYSILIPVYNVEKYLHECVNSALQQTFDDYEILLVNDGSTDNSPLICEEYAKKYPKKIRVFHKQNEGLLLTRRFSLKQAKGEYIIFLDSDDYISHDLLKIVNQAFEKHQCDMVIYNFNRFIDGSNETTSPNIHFENETIFDTSNKHILYESYIIKRFFVNMWIKAVKKNRIDIDTDYRKFNVKKCEDVVQSFALFTNCEKIVYIDAKLYFYRKNEGSVTLKLNKTDTEAFLITTNLALKYISLWNLSQDIYKKYISVRMSFFFYHLRSVYKKSVMLKNEGYFYDTLISLYNDAGFLHLVYNFSEKHCSTKQYICLKCLKYAFMKRKNKLVKLIIILSNLTERLKNGRKHSFI